MKNLTSKVPFCLVKVLYLAKTNAKLLIFGELLKKNVQYSTSKFKSTASCSHQNDHKVEPTPLETS